MADAYTVLKYRDSITLFSGTFTPATGTETIIDCTVTLFDPAGVVVAAMDEVTATGFVAGPQSAPYAYEGFSPRGLGLTEPSRATGQQVYSVDFEAIDSNGFHYVSNQAVVVKPRGS